MITIIDGAKGSGKTKKILDMANGTIATGKGDIVFVAATSRYRMEVKAQIKFVNALDEGINNKDSLVGFLKGLLCANYDIEYVFIDGFYKLMGAKVISPETEELFKTLEELSDRVKFVVTVSCDRAELPEYIKKYL